METEQFQVSNELHQIKRAVELAQNGLDTLEVGLADISHQFGNLYTQMQATGPPLWDENPPEADTADAAEPGENSHPDGAEDDDQVQRPSLSTVHAWVTEHIAPMVRKTTTTGEGGGIRWCRQWWHHHDAVERFTALHLAHEELSDSGEPSWLSVYLRDHLDPHLSTLTSPAGPFHACTPNRHSTTVAELGHAERPADTPPHSTDDSTGELP
ncbi:hypothetical protein BS329_15740 [Amycolatopsis coloradensis]|uniref:DUF4913 domain-containing protein n=2 Tax=Amycolatopsis coloradensis TaxID=76021 RepID=A0A1R0KUC6_9PSEU|nr:hypothetical protein BS329_15740 [Amycolatopsis coloradensis]